MNSIRCSNCNLTNWANAYACKRCGFNLGSQASNSAEGSQWQPDRYSAEVKSGLAIASMVIGIIAIPTSLFFIGILLAPIALVLGIVAVTKASRKPMVYGGKGFAIAGIATSSMAMLFIVPIIAAIAIPNLLAARRAANESSAIASLRQIHAAQRALRSSPVSNRCADLPVLGSANLLDSVITSGRKNGYRFEVSTDGYECDIHAIPVSASEGSRSFMMSQDGITYAARKNGLKADQSDPEL